MGGKNIISLNERKILIYTKTNQTYIKVEKQTRRVAYRTCKTRRRLPRKLFCRLHSPKHKSWKRESHKRDGTAHKTATPNTGKLTPTHFPSASLSVCIDLLRTPHTPAKERSLCRPDILITNIMCTHL